MVGGSKIAPPRGQCIFVLLPHAESPIRRAPKLYVSSSCFFHMAVDLFSGRVSFPWEAYETPALLRLICICVCVCVCVNGICCVVCVCQ